VLLIKRAQGDIPPFQLMISPLFFAKFSRHLLSSVVVSFVHFVSSPIILKGAPSDKGPFYHGTKADLKVGDLLTAGGISNYNPELQMNHIYFTANINGAVLAAALAKGEGRERVYIVEPTGEFENDPNVTDKKFPGNLTRSYRSKEPLRIIGEETKWTKLTTTELNKWRENLAKNKGEIIN
jgi:hypothetical protein